MQIINFCQHKWKNLHYDNEIYLFALRHFTDYQHSHSHTIQHYAENERAKKKLFQFISFNNFSVLNIALTSCLYDFTCEYEHEIVDTN